MCGIQERTQWIVAAIFLAVLAITVPIFSIKNNEASMYKQQTMVSASISPYKIPDNFDGVIIMTTVTNVNTTSLSCRMRYIFFPYGRYAQKDEEPTFSRNLYFVTNRIKTEFKAGEPWPTLEVVHSFDGLATEYPFDFYQAGYTISLYDSSTINQNNPKSIPIGIGLVAGKQSWTGIAEVKDLQDNQLEVSIRFQQSGSTKVFSMVLILN